MSRRLRIALSSLALFLVLVAGAQAVPVQQGDIRVDLDGSLSPRRLPRTGSAPVGVAVAAKVAGVGAAAPPALRRLQIWVNREGRFEPAALPGCTMEEIQPTTNADALSACGGSLVGEGRFSAQVGFTGQAPFPSEGKILAFNGSFEGHPAILAHIYGTTPAPTSYTLPFVISPRSGTFGTELSAVLPDVTGTSGYITGLSLDLDRTSGIRGRGSGYLTASCPAPKGFPGATFPFVRAAFSFVGGARLRATVTRSCQALTR